MSEKRNKYDTDPLDPDFVRRTEEMISHPVTSEVSRGERPTPQAPYANERAEDPTLPLEGNQTSSYPSVFVPPIYQPPANYPAFGSTTPPAQTSGPRTPLSAQQPAPGTKTRPSSRLLPKIGVPENVAMILPYAPFYIGLIASIVELVLVPRAEYRTRFHAAQGLALHLAIMAITFLFWIVSLISGSGFGGRLFWIASFIFLIVSMIRVWKGEAHRIAPLSDVARRINEQIEPVK